MGSWLPTTQEDIIIMMALVSVAISLAAIWQLVSLTDRRHNRFRSLLRRRDELVAGQTVPSKGRRKRQGLMAIDSGQVMTRLRRLANWLKLLGSHEAQKMSVTLARAGYRSKDALVIYLLARTILPVLCGTTVALLVPSILTGEAGDTWVPLLSVLGVVIGALGPETVLRRLAAARQLKISKALPDGLDLMVVCAEAGLALDAMITRVGHEVRPFSPELSDELTLTALELGFLPDRHQALDNFTQRTDVSGIKAIVTTLIQTETFGTPLARALRVLAAEFRDDRLMRAEEKAARLPAILTLPLVLFILPTLFIVLLGPAGIRTMETMSQM